MIRIQTWLKETFQTLILTNKIKCLKKEYEGMYR